MELSKRLQAVADLVTEGASVADIGTDHGYIPIYLIEHNIAGKVIALDINRGPLERARMHVVGHGLKGKIETRLSDGLEKVLPGEVDTMIAAGMGGGLVIKILTEGYPVVEILDTMILQPQSEIGNSNRNAQFLCEHVSQRYNTLSPYQVCCIFNGPLVVVTTRSTDAHGTNFLHATYLFYYLHHSFYRLLYVLFHALECLGLD